MQMKAKSPEVMLSWCATNMYFLMDSHGTDRIITKTYINTNTYNDHHGEINQQIKKIIIKLK